MKGEEEGKGDDRLEEKEEEETSGCSGSFFVARGPSRIRLFKEVLPRCRKKRNPPRARSPFTTPFRVSLSPSHGKDESILRFLGHSIGIVWKLMDSVGKEQCPPFERVVERRVR